jgi:hypothetical protein
MTVIEMIIKLLEQETPEGPDPVLSIFDCSDCIVRERGEAIDDVAGAAPWRDWIELDLR